jgi:hypothetical protein
MKKEFLQKATKATKTLPNQNRKHLRIFRSLLFKFDLLFCAFCAPWRQELFVFSAFFAVKAGF